MGRSRTDESEFRRIASEFGLDSEDVRKAVNSFFEMFLKDAAKLPFNHRRKIYTKEKFDEYVNVRNIPYIGRLGPAYSRYLRWRGNEAKEVSQVPRSTYQSRYLQSDIENMAAEILSGKTPTPLIKRKNSELYERVWLVGQDGKKSARQVIPKETEDGI